MLFMLLGSSFPTLAQKQPSEKDAALYSAIHSGPAGEESLHRCVLLNDGKNLRDFY